MSTLTPIVQDISNISHQPEFKKKLTFSKNEIETPGKNTTWKRGQKVYAPDPHPVWTRGTITEVLEGHLEVQTGTKTCRVAVRDVVLQPTDEDFVYVPDLTSISPLSAPAVLECLWRRYERGEVYTWAGRTLVGLNPFEDLPHLYGTATISTYHNLYLDPNDKGPPHVYGVAARAHSNMRCQGFQPNQSIVVSGESGAGKTVSARHLMKYLVTVANHSPIGQKKIKREDSFGCEIERRILNSNPILEAFDVPTERLSSLIDGSWFDFHQDCPQAFYCGNAGTLRNGNSSRFGKYIEIQFDRFGHVSGATIQTYLLEKTRVVHQPQGEFTFHIFYQMLAGLGPDAKRRLGLQEDLLDIGSRPSGEDLSHWRDTQEALTSLQVSDPLKEHLLQVLSAILLLNHTTITEDEDDEDMSCISDSPANMVVAQKAADLLQVDLGALETALTHRRITASHARRKSVFSKPCTAVEAGGRRDCLSKLLYNQVFEWLVSVINQNIHTDDVHTTIGLLDIYGFESFSVNSLEQLCINYANERLQQHYVGHYLRDQQEAYRLEAIPWVDVVYEDNLPCLHLLEGAPGGTTPGLFSLINEECQVSRPDGDKGLCDRLVGALGPPDGGRSAGGRTGQSPPGTLGTPRQTRGAPPGFVVTHYAAAVTYSATGLLDKNKDNIPPELLELLQKSTNPFITQLFASFEPDHPGKKKKTVLAKFKSSLDQLMQALSQTQPHYIRCIKPSPSSSPRDLHAAYVHEQLAACGIYQTVEVNRRGYPTRIPYEKFLQQYSLVLRSVGGDDLLTPAQDQFNKENELLFDPLEMLYQKQLKLTPRRQSTTPKRRLRRRADCRFGGGLSSCDHTRKLTASILCTVFGRDFATHPSNYCQFGISKLFLRDGKLEQLEAARLKLATTHVFTIQCAWRRYQRQKRQHCNQAATILQAAWRCYTARQRYQRVKWAVTTLQRAVRSWSLQQRLIISPSRSSSDDEEQLSPRVSDEFFTPREQLTRPSDNAYCTAGEFFTPRRWDHDTSCSDAESDPRWLIDDGNVTCVLNSDFTPKNLRTPNNQRAAHGDENAKVLYRSPRSTSGPQPPILFPTLRPTEIAASQSKRTSSALMGDVTEAFVVCSEQEEDGGKVYHIVRSPRPGVRPEPAAEVLRRVAASISATCVSRWRFNMAGAFAGIPYLEAQGGVLSRRRMPRVQIKFHTRPNPLLQGAHLISHQEFQCSLSDCIH